MRLCPKCHKWTLDFDCYFGRYRCYNPDCSWIAPSSTERAIRLLRSTREPVKIAEETFEEVGLSFSAWHDAVNDALLFDFGLLEPSFDLPESDGRMLWKIGHQTGSVCGFAILGAKEMGVAEIKVDIFAHKEAIEREVRKLPDALAFGKATRMLIDRVEVLATSKKRKAPARSRIAAAFKQVLADFQRRVASGSAAGTPPVATE